MAGMNMSISYETRLCEVDGKYGYFHTWEHYSKPLPASLLVGGEPAGVFGKVFGIVEFSDGVRRVDPSTTYLCYRDMRFIFRDGEYAGWYKP